MKIREAYTHKAKMPQPKTEVRKSSENSCARKKYSAVLVQGAESYFVQNYGLKVRRCEGANFTDWIKHGQYSFGSFCQCAAARLGWIYLGHNVPPVKVDNSNFIPKNYKWQ